MVPRNSTPGGFAYIWQSKWVGIIAIKTIKSERTQIHFPSDILIAVASLIGSLSNADEDNGNENGKKEIGLDWQNNNFTRASRFFVHFWAVVARLRRESASFHVFLRTGTQDDNFLFLFFNFERVL